MAGMTVYAIILTAITGFLLGFMTGANPKRKIKKETPRKQISSSFLTEEEYANFLSYDGSEQVPTK